MRNIEEIAAEEEARVRSERAKFLRGFLGASSLIAALWGWFLFANGGMEKGALAVCGSFLLFAASGRAFRLPAITPALGAALWVGLLSFFLYSRTCLPSFYWGKDPDLWLCVHEGAVQDPPWSPLVYLLAQASESLFPALKFKILPLLSGAVLSLALLFAVLDSTRRSRLRSPAGIWIALGLGTLLPFALPLWNAGTMGSGLVGGLGLLLFLWQRSLLDREEVPWEVLGLLLALLFCVHPLWGLLGTLRQIRSWGLSGRRTGTFLLSFLFGASPFLWILFRTQKGFPSWGGDHPFLEVLKGWNGPWASKVAASFEPGSALPAFGFLVGGMLLLTLAALALNALQWRSSGRSVTEPMDFWTGILSAAAGIAFYSAASGTLSPVALWFPVGLAGLLARLLERGSEKRQTGWAAGPRLALTASLVLGLSFAGAWAAGQTCSRKGYYLPLQHAFNLLRTLPEPEGEEGVWPGGTLLVCEDPFEAAACLEARVLQPFKLKVLILERRYLNRKWMVSECIQREPRLLFSSAEGSTLGILRRLVQDNGENWEIHWAVSELPDALGMGPATPTVLTQAFRKGPVSKEARTAQYHYDLTPFLVGPKALDPLARECLSRYATGFHELGRRSVAQEDYPEAVQAFERATKLDPDYLEPQMQLTDLYAKKNVLEAARLGLEKVVRTYPAKIADLAKALEGNPDPKDPKRVEGLDELIRLNGELAQAQYQLYQIFDKQGRGGEARALLEESAKNAPQRIEVQLALGRQMAAMGRPLKAEEAFRAVLLIDPQNKDAQREMWKLINRP